LSSVIVGASGSAVGTQTAFKSFDASGSAAAVTLWAAPLALSATTDTVRGGSGSSDVLRVTYAGAITNAATPTISGFESLFVTTGTNDTSAQSFSSTTGLTTVTVGGNNSFSATGLATGVALAVGQLSTIGGVAVANSVGAFGSGKSITFAQQTTTGTADTQTVNLVNSAGGTTTIALPGIETVNLNEGSTSGAAASAFALAIDTNTAGVANANSVTVNLTGGVPTTGNNVTLASGGLQSNVSVLNASAFVSGAVIMSPGSRLNAGAMTITTNTGNDTIIMRNGGDVLTAGTGTDTLVVASNAVIGGFSFDLNAADQVVQFAGSANTGTGQTQTGFEYLDLSLVTGNFGADITGRSAAVNSIVGTPNADNVVTGSASDTITGGNGADVINVGSGTDRLVFTANATAASAAGLAQTATVSNTGVSSGGIISPAFGAFDVITGMGRGDQIQFAAGANVSSNVSGYTSFTTVATVGTANLQTSSAAPVLIQGTYLATTGVFAVTSSGLDLLLEWDADGSGSGTVFEAVVLIGANTGFVNSTTTGSDSITGIVATSAGILTLI